MQALQANRSSTLHSLIRNLVPQNDKKKNLGAEDLNLGHKKYATCKLGNISYRNYKLSQVHVLNSIVYIP